MNGKAQVIRGALWVQKAWGKGEGALVSFKMALKDE